MVELFYDYYTGHSYKVSPEVAAKYEALRLKLKAATSTAEAKAVIIEMNHLPLPV